MSIATDIITRADENSGIIVNYKETTTWYDGSAITDAKVIDDGIIYKKKGNKYYKKTIDSKSFLKVKTISDLRNFNAYYVGQEITLMGYYVAGDKDPLNYIWKLGQGLDDDGYTINTSKGRWEAVVFNRIKPEDYGAKGDGTFDDGAAFQKALNYMKQGYTLVIEAKDYRTSMPLVMNSNIYQTIEGCAYTSGSGQGGVKSVIRVTNSFPSDAYMITTSVKTTIKNVGLSGRLNVNAINHQSGDIYMDSVVINIMNIGLNIKESYYSSLNKVDFRQNLKGMIIDYCYNLSVIKCSFNGGKKDLRGSSDHTGIHLVSRPSNVNIINSSLENYWGANSHAILVQTAGSSISLIGTYFEAYGENASDKCISAILVIADKVVININNSFAYLYNQENFIDLSQAYRFVLISKGNAFKGEISEESNVYKLNSDLTTLFSSSLEIGPDDFSNVLNHNLINYVFPKNSDGNMVYFNSLINPPASFTKDVDNVHIFNGRYTVNKVLNSEPTVKKKNTLYFANTSSWLPDGYSGYAQLPVIYDGSKFIPLLQNKELKTITTATTLNVNSNNLVDPSANLTVTLPASPRNNDFIFVKVTNKSFNVTIERNGKSIEQLPNNIIISGLDYVMLVYSSFANTWYIKYKKIVKSAAVSDVAASDSTAVSIADLTAITTTDATDPLTTQALVNELKAKLNLAITLINDTKAKYNTNVTLSNSNKAQLNAKLLADRNSGQQA